MTDSEQKPEPETTDVAPEPAPSVLPCWTSEQLFQGQREALIKHGEDTYRLRWTRNNKLILHK